MRVLVLNAGSSSLKASLVDAEADARLATAQAEWAVSDDDVGEVDGVLGGVLADLPSTADAVGYRVVHGGSRYVHASRVDEDLLVEVERLDALAPLHNRRAALVMRAARARLPGLPHVACFDTAFHASLPDEARRYALPDDWVEPHGIRRYGFHGLSVAWAVRRAAELLDRPSASLALVVAHLGSGSSVTAVIGGRSVATSMGFTPFEGLVMGTRSGSVDPGILLHLVRHGIAPDDLAEGLAARSGLLALAGTSDLRRIESAADGGEERAQLALEIYARSAAGAIGSAATALPRLDGIVFTGGIGEHAVAMRSAIAERLATLGVPAPLMAVDGDGVAAPGPPAVLVVAAQEDRTVAAEVRAIIGD
jgi:acetate kinase